MNQSNDTLGANTTEQKVIQGLIKLADGFEAHDEKFTIIEREALNKLIDQNSQAVIDKVYILNPKLYGFKGPKVGLEDVPKDVVRVAGQQYTLKDKTVTIPVQFLPRPVSEAFKTMNQAIKKDLGRGLLIESSYRSDAYQALVFLTVLIAYEFDLKKTAQRVAVPGYSQHGTPSKLALDLMTEQGVPQESDLMAFERTDEYAWLCEHAHEHNFYLSYPENNEDGVMFEPWHWQFLPK